MAKLIYQNQEIEIDDGESIKKACMEIGVPFGCESGLCGTCMIKILKGEDNLSSKNDAEDAMELDDGVRLGCQCTIEKGSIIIDL